MKRLPVLPTLLVGLAVAAMVALGFWQLLDRWPRKEAFLAQIAANPGKPPVAFPATADDSLLFRRSSVVCRPPVHVSLYGAGSAGFRAIARCGPASTPNGATVQLGTTRDPKAKIAWPGGGIAGRIAHQPDDRSLIAAVTDGRPVPLMLVAAAPPVTGLTPNRAPTTASIPNNHLAYAGQWFFFAGIAAIIYALALRRRRR